MVRQSASQLAVIPSHAFRSVFVPRHQTNSCNYEFWPYFVRAIFVSIAALLIERVEFVYFS